MDIWGSNSLIMPRFTTLHIISFLFLLIPAQLSGQVLPEEAAKVASHFLASKIDFPKQASFDIGTARTYIHSSDEDTLWYLFNFPGGGFVITAADRRIFPILAWSPSGEFDPASIPENCAVWMNWYEKQILHLKINSQTPGFNFENDWLRLLESATESNLTEGVEPLLTARWDQGEFYNALCPADPGGIDGHVPVGCVAVAMAQIMYYYRFPEQGNGFHSYIPGYNNGVYGLQFADFGSTSYRWNQMVDKCFTGNSAVAELCYHAAVSVNMAFTPLSSGANVTGAAEAMNQYFHYLPNSQVVLRQNAGGYEIWQQMITSNLENGQPLLYFSNNGFQGHAYVCDGYSDSLHFHFNWGWSGNHNGYYYINELIPGGIDLTQSQGAIFDLFPDTTLFEYPAFCQGNQWLTHSVGSLEDGSGPENYLPGNTCTWLVQPENPEITNIRLDFSLFDLTPGSDFLQIFDGEDGDAPLIGSYSGNTLPPVIISSQPALFLQLNAADTIAANGFHANYHAFSLPFCSDLKLISSPTGILNDGSDFFDYSCNMDCDWLLAPQVPFYDSVEKIRIEFTRFQLAGGDTLFVYDGGSAESPLAAQLSGSEIPSPIISTGWQLFLNFRTNEADSANGWEIRYTALPPTYCTDTTLISNPSGTIEDGSGSKNYVAGTFCHWELNIPQAEFITFRFTKVDMELNYDYVLLRNLSKPFDPPVRVTGTYIPEPFTVLSNNVLITFYSDGSDNRDGWELSYHTSAESIPENPICQVSVFPNPVTDRLFLVQNQPAISLIRYRLMNFHGKKVAEGAGSDKYLVIEMKNFIKGIYLLEIETGNQTVINKKIVKL